jgi:hypothetical protein
VISRGKGILGMAVDAAGNVYLGGSPTVYATVEKLSSLGKTIWRKSSRPMVNMVTVDSHDTVYAVVNSSQGPQSAKLSPGGKVVAAWK